MAEACEPGWALYLQWGVGRGRQEQRPGGGESTKEEWQRSTGCARRISGISYTLLGLMGREPISPC